MNEEQLIQTLADALKEKGFGLTTRLRYADKLISMLPTKVEDKTILKEELNDIAYSLLKLRDKL